MLLHKSYSLIIRLVLLKQVETLVTISIEGKITDMNEATVKITGVERELLTGSDFFDYFTEPQMAREVYQEVFAKDLLLIHHLLFVTRRKIDRCSI
jgi:PAS domain S-box-containing protein